MATGTIILPVKAADNFGALITSGARFERADGLRKILFAADSTEQIIYQFELPENYASAHVSKDKYAMASATSGKIAWETEVMAIGDGEDIDTASFDSVNEVSGGTTVPGTAGFRDTIQQSLTDNDSMAPEETVLMRKSRVHDDSDDTATGDMEYIGGALEYTTS